MAKYRFKQESPLQKYLQTKIHDKYDGLQTIALTHLLHDLKNIINKEILYDPLNPAIILCDSRLESALNFKALHVKELTRCVLEHLVLVTPFRATKRLTHETRNTKLMRWCNDIEEVRHLLNLHRRQQIFLKRTKHYKIKPLFKTVLKKLPHFPHHKRVFNYAELWDYLTKYITYQKHHITDPRHLKLCIVNKDPLGKAFNVNAFHECQIDSLLERNILPVV